jgi:hypothetical protein
VRLSFLDCRFPLELTLPLLCRCGALCGVINAGLKHAEDLSKCTCLVATLTCSLM